MMQRFEPLTLLRSETALNAWKEEVPTWTRKGRIEAAISVASGSALTQNELRRVESTHVALTYSGKVKVGDRLRPAAGGDYEVVFVIPPEGRRLAQLSLNRVEAVEA